MRVRLFTRAGCHLCDDARPVVARVCADLGVSWEEVDIAGSAELTGEYGDMIPVVEVDGRVIGFWRVDPGRIVSAVRNAGGGQR